MSKPAAFVIGYTGATGKALVQELAKDSYFGRVVLVGRREVELNVENDGRFEQKTVDYDTIEKYEDVFRGCDTGFCCLGTTRAVAGKDGFVKVDRDYVINTAKVAKATGCKHFLLLSSTGANKTSFSLYFKTKGEAEHGVRQLGFDRFSIFRPGLLIANRDQSRIGETLYRGFLAPAKLFFPTRFSIPVEKVARGMLNNAKNMTGSEAEFDNPAIFKLAADEPAK